MQEQVTTQAEIALKEFQEDFDIAYPELDVSPSLIKLCFLRGYAMGMKDMYKTVTDALLPKSDKQSV
jgi:hypothetical protein